MKKIIKIVSIMMLSFLIVNIGVSSIKAEECRKVIVIDPGHGGMDGGGKSKSGILEKDINLSISLKTKTALESKGYKVVMTRSEDIGLYSEGKKVREKKREDLDNRVKIKKDSNCDAFVSIHQNMFPQKSCKGAQVWSANNQVSQRLGTIIQQKFKDEVDQNNKRVSKVAKKEYKILNDGYEGASVIVECGFLSNEEESVLLSKDEYQDKIATAIVNAIDDYFKSDNEKKN